MKPASRCVPRVDYSIPWHLFSEDDADFFDQAQIQRGSSFIKFHRKLSRKELASLCWRLWNLRSATKEPKENHINFAIGDTLNEFAKRFGTKEREKFITQFVRIENLRDHALRITGSALIYLQTVEHLIKGCCAMLKLKGLKLTVQDFHSGDARRRRQTLGQLRTALINHFEFSDEFESHFNRFVNDRNHFVHTCWANEIKVNRRAGLPSERYFKEKIEFTTSLIKLAHKMELVFRGLLSSIVASFSERMKNHEVVVPWKKYVANFRATLRVNATLSARIGENILKRN